MACNADLVLENFKWRIENISPTYTGIRKSFRWIDPVRLDSEISSGLGERQFWVIWEGSGSDDDLTDQISRHADHEFTLTVTYSTDYKLLKRQKAMLNDRHDIIGLLRNTDYYIGYNSSNTTTDIGLHQRWRTGDEMVQETDNIWLLRIGFRCTIQEDD